MRKLIGILMMCAFVSGFAADEKLWLTDFEKAKAQAAAENRLIFLDFTGSDWCPPCKIVHKQVLSTKDFEAFAKENLVLVELDFPRKKPQTEALKQANAALAKQFKIEFFPTLIVLSKDGKELDRTVGSPPGGVKKYIKKIEELKKSQPSVIL